MKKLAVIGCGALAHILMDNIHQVIPNTFQITGFYGRTPAKVMAMAKAYGGTTFTSIDELIASQPDYVIELASVDAVKNYGTTILSQGLKLIIASIGALADTELLHQLKTAANKGQGKLFVINGAIGGFDVLQTMAVMNQVQGNQYLEMTIDNIKAPSSLNGAPYLKERQLSETTSETVFRGTVPEAIQGFPKNVNVAVAAAVAAQATDMEVVIRSEPQLKENKHIITLDNGIIRTEIGIYSKPDAKNPKSSTSTAWSVLALLKNLESPIFYY